MTRIRARRSRNRNSGFTVLELSVTLVIIAILLGAVTVGADVMRNAVGQKIFSEFVMGWSSAFSRYTALTNLVPGDDAISPTYTIRTPGGGTELCNNDGAAPELTNAFLARGIELPAGRTPGQEDRYVYQDSNGSPHMLQVCLMTLNNWAVPGNSATALRVGSARHVMRLRGLTVELAMQLDTLIDGKPDQRFGRFRSVAEAASSELTGLDWPVVRTVPGEDNLAEIPAYLLLN